MVVAPDDVAETVAVPPNAGTLMSASVIEPSEPVVPVDVVPPSAKVYPPDKEAVTEIPACAVAPCIAVMRTPVMVAHVAPRYVERENAKAVVDDAKAGEAVVRAIAGTAHAEPMRTVRRPMLEEGSG
ncbi:hypothetical protein [Microbacterium testaceum]|uniref:hypothetical protein n=1 Tax=Microbacterium testaceum TaxID=2033 RepID=UPI0027D79C20|nr:hypothetical protein [Microbacterium testaceum]